MITYLSPLLATDLGLGAFSVWDGETPRYDVNGAPVGPSNTTGAWPALSLAMQEPGFTRTHTVGTNSIKDEGTIVTRAWATTREQCEQLMGFVEVAFEKQVSVFQNVGLGGPPINPNFVFELTLEVWGCFEDENYRTATSQLLYRGDMYWTCRVHSSALTVT